MPTPFLSLKEMSSLIHKKKIQSKRNDLNIFVLSTDFLIKDDTELSVFFRLLSNNFDRQEIPHHFQLAIQDTGHWFGVDCLIKDGYLYLLILGAIGFRWGGLPSSLERIRAAIESLRELKSTIFLYNGIGIQRDKHSCSFFTLDYLFRLSNRKEHWDDLETLSSQAKKSDDVSYSCGGQIKPRTSATRRIHIKYLMESGKASPGIQYKKLKEVTLISFDEQHCPNSLAFIFKNIQSLKGFNALPERLKKSIMNKKGQTLEKIVNKNTVYERKMKKKINQGLCLKKKNIKDVLLPLALPFFLGLAIKVIYCKNKVLRQFGVS